MKKTHTNKKSVIMIVITMFLSAVSAWAENPSVKYISRECDANNQVVEKSLSVSNYTILDGADASKEIYLEDDAWYVVKDYEVKYSKIIVNHPNCHLILTDDAQLEAQICIPVNDTLTIYAQEKGLGRIIAHGLKNQPGIAGLSGRLFVVPTFTSRYLQEKPVQSICTVSTKHL